jgi:hypothetical protein
LTKTGFGAHGNQSPFRGGAGVRLSGFWKAYGTILEYFFITTGIETGGLDE